LWYHHQLADTHHPYKDFFLTQVSLGASASCRPRDSGLHYVRSGYRRLPPPPARWRKHNTNSSPHSAIPNRGQEQYPHIPCSDTCQPPWPTLTRYLSTIMGSESGSHRRSAASFPSMQRGHRHWRPGDCPSAALQHRAAHSATRYPHRASTIASKTHAS
jgi:hypothetical protein